ncbi:MAG: guanylate cyclase [Deltaproteobacteria bacterium]|nr:MAG: guanylate cyclase [Deltaproteobacteria bacterium]RLB09534.1 MAG: guanylate cyclase [Deltaproteobacteria bacterium]
MKCPTCQFENRNGVSFCEECGNKLELTCPNCGGKVPGGRKFCGYCGTRLKDIKYIKSTLDYSKPHSYTPPHLIEKILVNRSAIEGERKLVTVLFADVANYTSFSEKLDPEEVHQVMDSCFRLLLEEVHRFEGTINQFTGDGIMALFGAPLAHEDHAQKACFAALSIQRALKNFSKQIKKQYGLDFRMRIGLNSGLVIVGTIGDDLRMDYTALGDTTNLAARVEEAAKPGQILVTENTYRIASDYFEFESIGLINFKGKTEPTEVYRLLSPGKALTRLDVSLAKGLSQFTGREAELQTLGNLFKKACNSRGQIAAIVGNVGVGKSRLVFEFRQSLPRGDYLYLEGRCLPYGSSMAYLPILDILRTLFKIKDGENRNVIYLKIKDYVSNLDFNAEKILPAIYEMFSLGIDSSDFKQIKPRDRRKRIFEAVKDLLGAVSKKITLVIVVEDLHWIDKTSEELLKYLMDWIPKNRIFLLLLHRPGYMLKSRDKAFVTRIKVDDLSSVSSLKLIESILGDGEIDPELVGFILSKTGGNPLFIEEFTHTLLENGSIVKQANRFLLEKNKSLFNIPDTIQGIIASRIDRLEDNLKRTIQMASVIGRDFVFRVLEKITGMRDELKSYLLYLQKSEFIYEKRLFPELEYIFKHALIQEVAYESLLVKKRKEIHEKIGQAIEEIYGDRLEEFYEMLAHHYSESGNKTKAIKYLKLAGNKALRSHSLWEAFKFYRKAITFLDSNLPQSKKELVSITLQAASPMISLGFPEDSIELLRKAEKISKELGEEKSLSILYSMIGLYYSVKGDPYLGMQYTETSFEKAFALRNPDISAPTGFDLCSNYVRTGDFKKVVDIAPKMILMLEDTKKTEETFDRGYNIYSTFFAFYGYSLAFLGRFEEGKKQFEKGLRFAASMNNIYSLGLVECLYGYLYVIEGDGKYAIEHFEKSIKYLDEAEIIILLGLAWAGLGMGYYYVRDLKKAEKYIEKGLKIQEEAGIPYHISTYFWFLSLVYYDLNKLRKANNSINRALDLSRELGEKWVEGVSMTFKGRIRFGTRKPSDLEKGETLILDGIDILNNLGIIPFSAREYLFLGENFKNFGMNEKALLYLEQAKNRYSSISADHWYSKTVKLINEIQECSSER